MAATKISIRILNFCPLSEAYVLTPEDWTFKAQILQLYDNTTTTLGDPSATFEVHNGTNVDLSDWSVDFDISPTDTLFQITMSGTTNAPPSTTPPKSADLGTIKATINVPIQHGYDLAMVSDNRRFYATIRVVVVASAQSPSSQIHTVVRNDTSTTHNTLLNQMVQQVVHICPVIPVPWATGIPPLPDGVQNIMGSDQVNLSIDTNATDFNSLYNPAVIPVLDPADPDFLTKVARIRITQYWPADLDTDQLIWRAGTSNIKFWSANATKAEVKGGIEVMAYAQTKGNDDEPATIEVHGSGDGTPLLATFRALAGKPKYIWIRANIIKADPSASTDPIQNPTATPDLIKQIIAFNNVFFWQAGVLMVFDTDTTCYNNATQLDTGIFEVTNKTNYTFGITLDGNPVATLLNSREGVFNFAFIHSTVTLPTLHGAAIDRRLTASGKSMTLSGGPSTSWIRPTGVFPDDDAKPLSIAIMDPSDSRPTNQAPLCGDGAIDKICSCLITEIGAHIPGSITIVHELGHALGLNHRGSGGLQVKDSYDGVNHQSGPLKGYGHPWIENVMCYGPNDRRQDFDIIQSKIMRSHLLMKDSLPPATTIAAIPDANLPNTRDKILLQQYLSGKKTGLKHTNYNIGTTGPNGDGIDGVIGTLTTAALKQFQTDHGGLKIDGIYGPKTRAAFADEINAT